MGKFNILYLLALLWIGLSSCGKQAPNADSTVKAYNSYSAYNYDFTEIVDTALASCNLNYTPSNIERSFAIYKAMALNNFRPISSEFTRNIVTPTGGIVAVTAQLGLRGADQRLFYALNQNWSVVGNILIYPSDYCTRGTDPTPVPASNHIWRQEIFAGKNFDALIASSAGYVDQSNQLDYWKIEHNWPEYSGPVAGYHDNFSIRWTKNDFLPGRYYYYFKADDGIRILVDGNIVSNPLFWRDNSNNEDGADINKFFDLTRPGQTVTIEYYEGAQKANILMEISRRPIQKPIIPPIDRSCWNAEYFNTSDYKGEVRSTEMICQNDLKKFWSGNTGPSRITEVNGFSAKFDRLIPATSGGTMVFKFHGDDNLQVYFGPSYENREAWAQKGDINNPAWVGLTFSHESPNGKFVTKSMNQGQDYRIFAKFSETGGDAIAYICTKFIPWGQAVPNDISCRDW